MQSKTGVDEKIETSGDGVRLIAEECASGDSSPPQESNDTSARAEPRTGAEHDANTGEGPALIVSAAPIDGKSDLRSSESAALFPESVEKPGKRTTMPGKFENKRLVAIIVVASMILVAGSAWGNRLAWKRYTRAGNAAFEQEQLKVAEKYYLRALQEAQKYGNKDSRYAASLQCLGALYLHERKFDEAQRCLLEALRLRRLLLSRNNMSTVITLNSLGALEEERASFNQDADGFVRAADYYQQAQAMRTACDGSEVDNFTLMRMASLREQADPKGAMALCEKVLERELASSPTTSSLVDEVIVKLVALGEQSEAKDDAYERWLKMLASAPGRWEPQSVKLLMLMSQQQVPVADQEALYERAADLWQKYFTSITTPAEAGSYNRSAFELWARKCGLATKTTDTAVVMDTDYISLPNPQSAAILKRELAMLERVPRTESFIATVLNDLTCCTSLSIEQRKTYAHRAIGLWKQLTRAHASLWKNQASVHFEGWAVDDSIDQSYDTLIKLSGPGSAQAILHEELKMWQQSVGVDSPKIPSVLLRLAYHSGTAEKENLLHQSLNIWKKCLRQDSCGNAVFKHLLDESKANLEGWERIVPGKVPYLRRQFLELAEQVTGGNDCEVALALNSLCEGDLSIPLPQRESFYRRALRIWRNKYSFLSRYNDYNDSWSLFSVKYYSRKHVTALFRNWKKFVHGKHLESITSQEIAFWKLFGPNDLDLAKAYVACGELETPPKSVRSDCFRTAATIYYNTIMSSPDAGCGRDMVDCFRRRAALFQGEQAAVIFREQLRMIEELPNDKSAIFASVLTNLAQVTSDKTERRDSINRAAELWIQFIIANGAPGFQADLVFINGTFSLLAESHEGANLATTIAERELKHWESETRRTPHAIADRLSTLSQLSVLPDPLRIQFLKRAATLWQQDGEPGDSEIFDPLSTYDSLASLYRYSGQASQEPCQRALDLEASQSEASPFAAKGLNNLAFSIQQDWWQRKSAMPLEENLRCKTLYQRALAIWKRHIQLKLAGSSEWREHVEFTLWQLASLSSPDEAVALNETCFEIEQSRAKFDDSYVIAFGKLFRSYFAGKHFDKAEALYKRALKSKPGQEVQEQLLVIKQAHDGRLLPRYSNDQWVDFAPYMKALNMQVRLSWTPNQVPEQDPAFAKVIFRIDKDGRISSLRSEKRAPTLVADQFCIQAIEKASPFPPLKEAANISFTFSGRSIDSKKN